MGRPALPSLCLLLVFLLIPLASVSSHADQAHDDPRLAHIFKASKTNQAAQQELLKFNAKRPEGSPVAEQTPQEVPVSEESPEKDDDEVEEEKGEEDGGEVDPLVQERFRQLEAALKGLTTQEVDSHEELNSQNLMLNVEGAKGSDVISLLHKYAHELHQKLQENREIEEPQQDHQSHEAIPEHKESGHGHHHHHHNHERANVGFSSVHDAHQHEHDHSGHKHHSHGHGHGHRHGHEESDTKKKFRLPEEIAEEDDLLQYGFEGQVYSSADQPSQFGSPDLGVWLRAMGCSLLVSLASLICLMILPLIVSKDKPSEKIVDALASFGAGAMLGDAFLHQLPHAFGSSGPPPHSHDAHQHDHTHGHSHSHGHGPTEGHGHAHSLQDLSIGLAVLGGILLFFVVEKIVRRYEELSHGVPSVLGHSHHHHRRKKDSNKEPGGSENISEVEDVVDGKEVKALESRSSDLKKRNKGGKKKETAAVDNIGAISMGQPQQQVEAGGGFVIGYLNLFSDAVHNFTDGMALGSAFLLHGSVGGWSRTLFLLAHEIPQEVGDFGILVKSGFSVFEALAFNFLSALVALAGTALALVMGGNLGHSSLIEGFIAGGFIYMAVGGVMPSMHNQGSSLSSTLSQLVPMVLGIGVAVAISLSE